LKIAANHALSDCHAMCADAKTALAIAVVPYAIEEKMEESLYQVCFSC
jgi:selenide,water dikinase